jgi:hypothetical protein
MVYVGAVGKAGRHQRPIERLGLAYSDATIFQMRARAARGAEDLPAHRVIHDGVLKTALDLAGDRYGEHREAVQKVSGAVQGINDPHRVVVTALAALFGQERVLRVMTAYGCDDLLFRGLVNLGDEVIAPLGGDREGLQAIEAADDDFAGAARGAHGNIEKRLHGN